MSEDLTECQIAETKEADSSDSSEVSACTAVMRLDSNPDQPATSSECQNGSDCVKSAEPAEVILSAERLLPLQEEEEEEVEINSKRGSFVEIELEEIGELKKEENSFEERTDEMFQNDQPISQVERNGPPRRFEQTGSGRGFGETEARLCVASKRLRDYLDSLRRSKSSSERRHFYQFFKSIRTELVASLLFTLITSQALISLRANLQQPSTNNNRLGVQLLFGSVSCITVATLTQVFGPISGCHLIPANSLALYLKGYISRFRLASYLFAQSAGALLAVSLLTLLTSSQLTSTELAGYNQIIQSHIHPTASFVSNSSQTVGSVQFERRRRKRESNSQNDGLEPELEPELPAGEPGSTILVSIMEQAEEERRARRLLAVGQVVRPSQLPLEGLEGKTINGNESHPAEAASGGGGGPSGSAATNKGTYQVGEEGSANKKQPLEGSSAWGEQQKQLRQQQPPAETPVDNRPGKEALSLQVGLSGTRSLNDIAGGEAAAKTPELQRPPARRRRRSKTRPQTSTLQLVEPGPPSSGLVRDNNPPQPSSDLDPSPGGGGGASNERFINLLGLALPEPVMASDSIRQCQRALNSSSPARAFDQCLSLSNPSQMFIFQLLASLLIVLTHLVNVDPRRSDLGFKSLSIGLSYFVASVLTLQSGGFYGNPSQVVFLSLFATSGQWQTEWLVYLATPLIAGLFGAMSHEYIDFSSLRNRNKELHLRRSFYSLEEFNIEQEEEDPPASACCNNKQKGTSNCSPASCESLASGITIASELQQQASNQRNSNQPPDQLAPTSDRKSYARQLRLERHRMLQAEVGRRKRSADLQQQQQQHTFQLEPVGANFLVQSSAGLPTASSNFVVERHQRRGSSQNGFVVNERFPAVALAM